MSETEGIHIGVGAITAIVSGGVGWLTAFLSNRRKTKGVPDLIKHEEKQDEKLEEHEGRIRGLEISDATQNATLQTMSDNISAIRLSLDKFLEHIYRLEGHNNGHHNE